MLRFRNPRNYIFISYFLAIFTLLLAFWGRKSFALVNIETISPDKSVFVFFLLSAILGIYFGMYRLKVVLNKPYLAVFLLLMILLTFSLPIFSTDLGANLISAKNLVIYHANPYIVPLNHIQGDEWVRYMSPIWWMSSPIIYGPIALAIAAIPAFIASNYFYAALVFYKLIVLSALLASSLIFRKLDRSKRKIASTLFLLNPILLICILLDGHNDAFVLLFFLLYLFLLKQEKQVKSFVSLIAGIFVKYTSIILLPAYFVKNRKINWAKLLISISVTAALFYLCVSVLKIQMGSFLPQQSSAILERCLYVCTPIIFLLKTIFHDQAKILRIVLFMLAYAAIIIRYLFVKYDLYKFSFWSFIALFFIASMGYAPWYSICPIAAGLLVNEKKYYYFVIILTAYSALFYFGI